MAEQINRHLVNAVHGAQELSCLPRWVIFGCLGLTAVPLVLSQHHRGMWEQHPHMVCANWGVLHWQRKARHDLWENWTIVFFWVGKNSVVLLPLEESGFAFLLLSFTSLAWFPKIFNQELFGTVAEEKEVKGIVSKVMEARKNKSYDSYEILGKFIGKGQVTKLILPLKEVRKVSQSLS